MNKKFLCVILALVLAVTPLLFSGITAMALPAEKEELENKIDQIDAQIAANKQKLESLKDKKDKQMEYLETLEDQIEAVESKVSSLQTQIENIDSQVKKLNTELKQLDNEIAEINSGISQAEKDIVTMQDNITSTSDQLAAKLRSSYMNGSESALKILMGSDSLASFLTRLEMMKRTSEKDKSLILGFRDKVTKLNKTKEKLEKDKVEVTDKINEANEKKALSLEKKEELKKKQAVHDETMSDLESKYSEVENIISGFDKSSAEYKKYITDLQLEKAEADAEIDRILSEYYATQTTLPVANNEPTSSQSGGTATTKPAGPSYTAKGDWIWPLGNASCYISSPFGYRSASISGNSFHGGTDIAGGGISGKPVYASRAGKVITAVTSNRGYGIYVLIDHGDGYSTLYAHMSARYVSAGDNVSKGQMIGRVGSTGNSTGPHLHFEVRYYGEKKNPMSFVKKP